MGDWWQRLNFFRSGQADEILRKVENDNDNGFSITPTRWDVFKALDETPYRNTKVLILGQDPYPTPGHANGLAFSTFPEVSTLPRSLQNIFRELSTDLEVSVPINGDLTKWANQGILLLNTVLTTREHQSNAHKDFGWQELAKEVIEHLNRKRKGVAFVFWGKQAGEYSSIVTNPRHLVLKSSHPSPYSAPYGFFGSKPFSKINAFLDQPIDWRLP